MGQNRSTDSFPVHTMVTRLPFVHASPADILANSPISAPIAPPKERLDQAWDLMKQAGLPPESNDWIRPEVAHAWLRCIEHHQLPLGADFVPGPHCPVPGVAAGFGGADIVALLDRISPVLHGARLSLLVTTPKAELLHLANNGLGHLHPMRDLIRRGADWREAVLGNNGPGTAALTDQPAAFTGREHFSRRLHPFSTVGYPLEGPDGRVAGVIGLIGDADVGASVLLGVMGLVIRLLAAETPLRHPGGFDTALRFASRNFIAPGDTSTPPAAASIPPEPAAPPVFHDSLADELVSQATRLQARRIPILITGESGVGKEHLVRLVHAAGPRREAPLIAVNCASLPRDLIESELFGYEGGSFTGARSQGKPGKFLLADKGVLFLDEIGDMSFDLQATLLRVLENSEFMPVGGTRPVKVDVHVIAATNVRLLDAVEQGRFRRDLYYRLNGAQLRLPPLRERPDKRGLIEFLLARECELAEVPAKRLSPEVRELFLCHPWPGNIRQLRNLLRTLASVVHGDYLTMRDLPEDFLEEMRLAAPAPVEPVRAIGGISTAISPSLEDWECHAIEDALRKSGGNVTETARVLGISRSTLYVKLQRYNLTPERRCR